jgi:hypothetical protein
MSSPVQISVEFPPRDIANLQALMARARVELKKSMKSSLAWGGYHVARSLAASTRMAPELRRVIRNPDERWKTDHRRAPYGVMAPKGYERTMTFKPIYRTGEFGKVRFFDKKSMSWFRHTPGGGGKWEHIPSGQVEGMGAEATIPGIMSDRRRKIGRRGLGKKTWTGLHRRMSSGGTVRVGDVASAGAVTWRGRGDSLALHIENDLRYAGLAFRAKGKHAVTSAVARAHDGMRNRIETALDKLK